jgi:hypothetical protein
VSGLLGLVPSAPRPGIQVTRAWVYDDAVRLDSDGEALIRQVREALNQIMAALDEPQLPVAVGLTRA